MKTRIRHILFAISVIISVLLMLYSIGRTMTKPFSTKITVKSNSPCFIEKNAPSLIVDRDGTRLLFTNSDFRVSHIERYNRESPIDRVTDVACDGSNFYVLGVRTFPGSLDVDEVKIVKYSLDGRNPRVIYSVKADPKEKEAIKYNMLFDLDFLTELDVRDGILYVSEFHNFRQSEATTIDCDLKVSRIDPNAAGASVIMDFYAPYMYCSDYYIEGNKVYFNDYSGRFAETDGSGITYLETPENSVVGPFRVLADGRVAWIDNFSSQIHIGDRIVAQGVGIITFGKSRSGVAWVSVDQKIYFMPDCESEVQIIDKVSLSASLALLTIAETAAYLWLILLVLFFSIRKVITLYREGKHTILAKIGIVIAAVVCSVTMATYYTKEFISADIDKLERKLHQQCMFFARTTGSDEIETPSLRRINGKKPAFSERLDTYTDITQKDGEYLYIAVLKKNNGEFVSVYDSRDMWQYGIAIDYERLSKAAENSPNHIGTDSSTGYNFKYDIQPIKNKQGETTGAVFVCQEYKNIQDRAWKKCMQLAIELFTIFISAYVIISEASHFIKGKKEGKKKKLSGSPCPELSIIRTYNFTLCLMTAFDRVLLVLITKNILEASPLGTGGRLALLIALPSMLIGIGGIIGAGLYGILSKRLTIRRLVTGSVFTMFLCNCGIVLTLAVAKNSAFVLFCSLKLFSSIANECAYCAITAMPLRSSDETVRYESSMGRTAGKISSGILGTLIGGFIFNKFSYVTIYLINTVAFIPVLLLYLLTLPRHTSFVLKEKTERKANAKGIVRFMTNPAILFYFVFLTLPIMAISGYKNFLFPLYSSALDIPKIYITTLSVFSQVAAIGASVPVADAAKKSDHWLVAAMGLGIIGAFFLGFGISPGITWAIIVLIVVSVLEKLCNVSREMLWPRMAAKYNFNAVELSGPMFIARQLANSLKEPILSLFLLFGNDRACVLFGVFCTACAALFLVTTARSALRARHKDI